jgi:hypothetical protein
LAFQQWTVSPKHLEAIVVRHTTDAGFGYAVNDLGWGYFVGVFGTGTGEAVSQSEEELAMLLATENPAAEKAVAQTAATENVPAAESVVQAVAATSEASGGSDAAAP